MDAAAAAAFEDGVAINSEDGVSQADLDAAAAAAFADGVASVTPEDGVTQADLDAVHAMYGGWCESDIDNDGMYDVNEVSGCMDANSCNYNVEAELMIVLATIYLVWMSVE